MHQQQEQFQPTPLDVLIIGAGLSGIGMARALTRRCPDKRYLILERRNAIGGTWDLFRYPGIRSDSDMYTLGYADKPWTGRKAIADGPDIKRYIEEAAEESGAVHNIRYGHRVLSASWDSEQALWTVRVQITDGPGPGGRPCHHAAAFAKLRICPSPGRQPGPGHAEMVATAAGLPPDPLEKRAARQLLLSAGPQPAGGGQPLPAATGPAAAGAGRRHAPLHPRLQALGPACLRRA